MGLSPEDSQHVVDSVALSWPYVGLALLGGLARACRFGVHSVKQFIGGLLCSGISGLLCILALYDQDVPPLPSRGIGRCSMAGPIYRVTYCNEILLRGVNFLEL